LDKALKVYLSESGKGGFRGTGNRGAGEDLKTPWAGHIPSTKRKSGSSRKKRLRGGEQGKI